MIKKVASRLGFLYRGASLLDFWSRRVVCMALVQPCIDFCIVSWYVGLSGKLREKLAVLQRKMVRYVYGWGPRAHVGTGTLKELGWLLISDRVRYFAVLHAFRIRKGSAPSYLSRNFTRIAGVHSHQTRGSAFDFHLSGGTYLGAFLTMVKYNGTTFRFD